MARSPGYPFHDLGDGGLDGLDGFSFKKIVKAITSVPKRVAGLAKVTFLTPFKLAQAVVSGRSVSQVLKGAEREMRRSGALPGDVRKYGERYLPVVLQLIPGIGTATSFAIQAAVAARQVYLAKQTVKKLKAASEYEYAGKLQAAYGDYTAESKKQGAAPISFPAFKAYIETGVMPFQPGVV